MRQAGRRVAIINVPTSHQAAACLLRLLPLPQQSLASLSHQGLVFHDVGEIPGLAPSLRFHLVVSPWRIKLTSAWQAGK